VKHGYVEEASTVPPDPPDVVIGDAARRLADLLHGPYSGLATAEAAALAAETVRYLNYAAMHGGVAEPSAVVAELCAAVYRFPQLLGLLSDWATAEAGAGRIADDMGRPAWQLVESARAVLGEACEHADALARCLGVAHSLTVTLHAADPAAASATPRLALSPPSGVAQRPHAAGASEAGRSRPDAPGVP
jgi:hypothetical protein